MKFPGVVVRIVAFPLFEKGCPSKDEPVALVTEIDKVTLSPARTGVGLAVSVHVGGFGTGVVGEDVTVYVASQLPLPPGPMTCATTVKDPGAVATRVRLAGPA